VGAKAAKRVCIEMRMTFLKWYHEGEVFVQWIVTGAGPLGTCKQTSKHEVETHVMAHDQEFP
jgi:hypothetical protein